MSRNKNNYNSQNNDLKNEQNYKFEEKETLIWTRNWSDLYGFLKYKQYTKNSLKQRPGEKKLKTMAYLIPNMGQYRRNG